jgi:TRAP-type mannitol/chloroaromatic compound transport system substrate-binding protein
MAPGDVFPALQAGTLDATDFTGPANDMALGFHQVCKYYYWPGIHKPGAVQQVIVNKAKYDALPADLKDVVRVACQASHQDMLAEYNWINSQAAVVLREKHGVKFLRLPEDMLVALGTAAGQILIEERDKLDPLGKKIWEAYFKAREAQMSLTDGADRAFFNARTLNFKYVS